jgi:hypothetical protein
MKIFSKLLFSAQCVVAATVLAQGLAAGALWFRGDLGRLSSREFVHALDGIDIEKLHASLASIDDRTPREIISYGEVIDNRIASRLDFDLRETSLEKGRQETRDLQDRLKSAGERYEVLKRQFDASYSRLARGAADQRLLELQENLESMKPAQAKEQIQRLLAGKSENAFLNDVVAIIKTMSGDKRKKLFAEFQTPQETKLLAKILDRIRRGLPDSILFRETRDKLRVDHDASGKPAL